jgi:hypothetical protein
MQLRGGLEVDERGWLKKTASATNTSHSTLVCQKDAAYYYCFATALLLLYHCFTTALPLL